MPWITHLIFVTSEDNLNCWSTKRILSSELIKIVSGWNPSGDMTSHPIECSTLNPQGHWSTRQDHQLRLSTWSLGYKHRVGRFWNHWNGFRSINWCIVIFEKRRRDFRVEVRPVKLSQSSQKLTLLSGLIRLQDQRQIWRRFNETHSCVHKRKHTQAPPWQKDAADGRFHRLQIKTTELWHSSPWNAYVCIKREIHRDAKGPLLCL